MQANLKPLVEITGAKSTSETRHLTVERTIPLSDRGVCNVVKECVSGVSQNFDWRISRGVKVRGKVGGNSESLQDPVLGLDRYAVGDRHGSRSVERTSPQRRCGPRFRFATNSGQPNSINGQNHFPEDFCWDRWRLAFSRISVSLVSWRSRNSWSARTHGQHTCEPRRSSL
jgi:hypothetical protein